MAQSAGRDNANIGFFGLDALPDAPDIIAKGDIYRRTISLDIPNLTRRFRIAACFKGSDVSD
jgi:hypothetical protein